MDETISVTEWKSTLPKVVYFKRSVQTVTSIIALAQLLQTHIPEWSCQVYSVAGHILPLTHPQIINPILSQILNGA